MPKRPRTGSPAADLPFPDDLLLSIFLRLPPDPNHLAVASVICKRWRRLIRDPAFLVSFRAFHRGATPVLGFYQNIIGLNHPIEFVPIAAPTPRLSAPRRFEDKNCSVLDCRHGRVLIYDDSLMSVIVWDPMTAKSSRAIPLPQQTGQYDFTAAVVCTPGPGGHTDCHSAPYQIVYMENSEDDELMVYARVFSSKTKAWGKGELAWIITPSLVSADSTAAVVGNSVYWKLVGNINHILEFEMQTEELDLIELPTDVQESYKSGIHLMPAKDGGIGFAGVNQSSLHFWSRKTDHEAVAEWAKIRIIDMQMLPISDTRAGDMLSWSSVVCFADDSDVLFLRSRARVFMINLSSEQLTQVPRASASAIYPYTSFYTRGRGISSDRDVKDDIKVPKEKGAGSAQAEAVDKEQAELSSSGHQVRQLLTK